MNLTEFKETVHIHKNRLYRIAKWMLNNSEDAEDLVQEVYLKLWRMRDDLGKYRSVEGLLVQMTKNLCLNKIKARKHEYQDVSMDEIMSVDAEIGKRVEDIERLRIAKEVIGQLPHQQQLVIQMKGVEGLEIKEIAEMLNETDNNVRVILSRARKTVRSSFEKIYSHEG